MEPVRGLRARGEGEGGVTIACSRAGLAYVQRTFFKIIAWTAARIRGMKYLLTICLPVVCTSLLSGCATASEPLAGTVLSSTSLDP